MSRKRTSPGRHAAKKSSRADPAGVSRVDRAASGAYGWKARIRREGELRTKWFSDSKHGGPQGARRAARAQYEAWAAEMPPAQTTHREPGQRNVTGVAGVAEGMAGYRADGSPNPAYVASWREGGKSKVIRFSWAVYGKRRALRLAAKARELKSKDRAWLESLVPGTKRYLPKGPLGRRRRVSAPVDAGTDD